MTGCCLPFEALGPDCQGDPRHISHDLRDACDDPANVRQKGKRKNGQVWEGGDGRGWDGLRARGSAEQMRVWCVRNWRRRGCAEHGSTEHRPTAQKPWPPDGLSLFRGAGLEPLGWTAAPGRRLGTGWCAASVSGGSAGSARPQPQRTQTAALASHARRRGARLPPSQALQPRLWPAQDLPAPVGPQVVVPDRLVEALAEGSSKLGLLAVLVRELLRLVEGRVHLSHNNPRTCYPMPQKNSTAHVHICPQTCFPPNSGWQRG